MVALIENFVDSTVGHVRLLMALLLGAVCMVLLIACGNAANLLLARAARPHARVGRACLRSGAARSRIVRQLLTEALLIGLTAGAIGVGIAYLFLRTLPRLDPGNIPRLNEASLDNARAAFYRCDISLHQRPFPASSLRSPFRAPISLTSSPTRAVAAWRAPRTERRALSSFLNRRLSSFSSPAPDFSFAATSMLNRLTPASRNRP